MDFQTDIEIGRFYPMMNTKMCNKSNGSADSPKLDPIFGGSFDITLLADTKLFDNRQIRILYFRDSRRFVFVQISFNAAMVYNLETDSF